MNAKFETERKFLIEMPDLAKLESDGAARLEMIQTYLECSKGMTARVRMVEENSEVRYIYTSKKHISTLTCIEEEKEITENEYKYFLNKADKKRKPITKTRYRIPFDSHVIEIDIYPFWRDRAVMEIELQSETEHFAVPSLFKIIKEVTDDVRYKNFALASGNIPD